MASDAGQERVSTTRHKINSEAASRRQKDADREAALRAKRFKGSIVRGAPFGKRRSAVDEKVFIRQGHKRREISKPHYNGQAIVWATLDPGTRTIYRAWPEDGSEPFQMTATDGLSSRPYAYGTLHSELGDREDAVQAFTSAESSDDPSKKISKAEAVLIVRFKECFEKARDFVIHCKLLERPRTMYHEPQWSPVEQEKGRKLCRKLQKSYNAAVFPSSEAVCLGAEWLAKNWYNTPAWFRARKAFVDPALAILSDYFWRSTGPVEVRKTLKNLPLRGTPLDFDVFHQGIFNDYVETMDHEIIHYGNLRQLTSISPIAIEAMNGTVYTPKKEKPATTIQQTKPKEPYRNEHYDECIYKLDFWYSGSDKIARPPLSIGPHKLLFPVVPDKAQATTALRLFAFEFKKYAHWELLAMVWRDFVVPSAFSGNTVELQANANYLRVMLAGHRVERIAEMIPGHSEEMDDGDQSDRNGDEQGWRDDYFDEVDDDASIEVMDEENE